MHILECYFETGGYDFKLVKGGTSVYLWNLARKFAERGHEVSILTAAHGQLAYLQTHYPLEPLPYEDAYQLPLHPDPPIWSSFPPQIELALTTRAYRLSLDGIKLYFLANEYLNLFPETFYPPYECKGRNLGFFKPLVFQVDSIRFIRRFFGNEKMVVHLHEPYYHYLLPVALRQLPNKVVVTTVQSNMPINKKVYRPKVEHLFQFLNVDIDLDRFMDGADDGDGLTHCMEYYLPRTHLHYPYRSDYIAFYSLVVAYSDLIDFLSPGQQRFYSSFDDTPFELLFERLTVAQVVRANAHKQFIGWCAISPLWLAAEPTTVDRTQVLQQLGLKATLPTFYHNARYALHHKGQLELMRAINRVLSAGCEANFIIHCLSSVGIDNLYFHDVRARFPENIYLDWHTISEETLISYACAADFSLFPSKFEMDTFLIAQGEAMACGAVPIATAQQGMSHFNHALPLDHPQATGFAVRRSFQEDDPLLVEALAERIREAITLYHNDPATYRRLVANGRQVVARFTWDFAAEAHLAAFAKAYNGQALMAREEAAQLHGWFDLLDEETVRRDRGTLAEAALRRGDHRTFLRCRRPDAAERRQLFAAAFERAEFGRCAEMVDIFEDHSLRCQLADRCRLASRDGGLVINYRLPQAEHIELFLAEAAATRTFRSVAMQGSGGVFTAWITPPPGNGELYFLLVLNSGRVTWDKIRYE